MGFIFSDFNMKGVVREDNIFFFSYPLGLLIVNQYIILVTFNYM